MQLTRRGYCYTADRYHLKRAAVEGLESIYFNY